MTKVTVSETSTDKREWYFTEGISYLRKLLELIDRNRLNRTYGCFDRGFWHYRTSDFPSGMYQEGVLPLALAYTVDHPKNPYRQNERIKELTLAGIDFARKTSHGDGSCDDYFPYERASGATAFSLYACTEACLELNIKDSAFFEFFDKRAGYLAGYGYEESGILSNHKALIVLAVYNTYLLTREPRHKKQAEKKLGHLLSLQSPEGWFPEYEGCDPGYLSFTIDFIAKYFQKSKDEKVLKPLLSAIEFAAYFMHPDGSFGGEYGSRNTFHLLPHGCEIMAPHSPVAQKMANSFLDALAGGSRSYVDDDRIFIHYVYNYLQAWRDFYAPRTQERIRNTEPFSRHFEHSGLVVESGRDLYAVLSLRKGGVGKIYLQNRLVWSDAGFAGRTDREKKFISQTMGDFLSRREDGGWVIEGSCYEYRDLVFSPLMFLLFRFFILAFGRFLPANITRSILQKKAITKKHRKFPLRFKKEFHPGPPVTLKYTFFLEDTRIKIKELWIATDATFIYIATSQPWQPGVLKSWQDLSELLAELNEKGQASFKQVIS